MEGIKYLFYAKVLKGFIPKTTFDALATSMNRITLRLTKTGIFIRQTDSDDIRYAKILWDVEWNRENFSKYTCLKEFNVTLNSKHIQRMLKSVKKKESVAFFITENDQQRINITIQPTGSHQDGPSERAETVSLSMHNVSDENLVIPDLPDIYPDNGVERKAYGYPMVIGANDFQKIKKMATSSKTIHLKIQRNNYISFYAGDSMVLSSKLEFGKLLKTFEDGDEHFEILKEEGNQSVFPCIYEQEFTMSLFTPLIKLPGLTFQMEFYSPKFQGFPLKVKMKDSAGLGSITVFIKDHDQINIEDRSRTIESPIVNTKRSKKNDLKV
jgi:hypothetical protein